MILQPIQIVQGNYGYNIPFTLEDGSGNKVNLTGATLTLYVQSAQDPTDTLITLSGSMTIDNATAGICHYAVANGDFPNPGTFLCQIVAVYAGEQLSWQGPQIIVLPALPKAIN